MGEDINLYATYAFIYSLTKFDDPPGYLGRKHDLKVPALKRLSAASLVAWNMDGPIICHSPTMSIPASARAPPA
jgi:hypothetical protein